MIIRFPNHFVAFRISPRRSVGESATKILRPSVAKLMKGRSMGKIESNKSWEMRGSCAERSTLSEDFDLSLLSYQMIWYIEYDM
jgi:hypothetical protein